MQNSLFYNKELKQAIKIIWILSAVVSSLIFVILWSVDNENIMTITPTCEFKKMGKECFLCGSTRAFCNIKTMNLDKAYQLNRFSIFLFIIMIMNILIFIVKTFFDLKLTKKRNIVKSNQLL
ncbi:MAG: DUF2752 domain-containing protein [Bacteroidota bacterium]|nr:DUF2752 domain-containing protein [Bacteroidota bacterium]